MSENSNTDTAVGLSEPAQKQLEIYAPIDQVNDILATFGVPMPDATDLDTNVIHVDHSKFINRSDLPDLGDPRSVDAFPSDDRKRFMDPDAKNNP